MDSAGFDRTALRIRSDVAIAAASHAVTAQTDAAALVDAIDALRLAVLAAAWDDLHDVIDDPGRWMRVDLADGLSVFGLAREATWAGVRWVEVSWPAYTVGGVNADAGLKLYRPDAIAAVEEIGEAEVMQNLTAVKLW